MTTLFRSLLLGEAAINVASAAQMILTPESFLSMVVKGPAQITPGTKSLVQWVGAFMVLPTVPLLLSYPGPSSTETAEAVTTRRRLTYIAMGATEAVLGVVTASQYVMGDSGMSDNALLVATAMMFGFGSLRAYFLYGQPSLMGASKGKTQ